MTLILVGASGTGKDSVLKVLKDRYGYKGIVSYTTRSPRENEIEGIDYHFITLDKFKKMNMNNEFIETDKYSGERYYGSRKIDYCREDNTATILTPNGVRQLLNNSRSRNEFFIVYLYSPLSVKCKRYIDRERKTFDVSKLMELLRRSIADEEMFRGFESVADLCIENNEYNTVEEIADLIAKTIEEL